MVLKIIGFGVLLWSCWTGLLLAQTPPLSPFPNGIDPRPQPFPSPPPLPEPQESTPLITPPPTSIETPIPPSSATTIRVKQFKVEGSTVYTAQQLNEIIVKTLQAKGLCETGITSTQLSGNCQPLSILDLSSVADAITQRYQADRYSTSGAYLPEQTFDPETGIITLQVIEGKAKIEIVGNQRLQSNYIISRLNDVVTAPLNTDRILDRLQVLQLDPLIDYISAELMAGSRLGENILRVTLKEAKTWSSTISLNNSRSPSVGSTKTELAISQGNVLGFGDRFSLSYSLTDGSNGFDAIAYSIPLNRKNGTLQISANLSDSNVIEKPFDRLDIESQSHTYELTYRQPLSITPTTESAIGLTFSRRGTSTSLLGIPFPLSAGSDDNGNINISVLRFFQEWTKRDTDQITALRSQFSFGVDWLGTTTQTSSPDSRFFAWRGQAQYIKALTPDTQTLFVFRSDLQLADRPLLGLEQFSIGGNDSVRGYRQDSLLLDNGLYLTSEIRFPILTIPQWKTTLKIVPFFDLGTGWNSSNDTPEIHTLISSGLGLLLQSGSSLTARLDWGLPLTSFPSPKNTLQENGIHFSIEYHPF